MARQHKQRRIKARMIRAAAKMDLIRTDAAGVEWIQAAAPVEGESPKPKKFSMTAYTGGAMNVDRYGPPVCIDLAGLKAEAPLPILLNHDLGRIVGHADEIEITGGTLKVKGVISGAGESAIEVVASAGNGFPWKASVGARPDKLEFVGEDVTTKVNGKTLKGPLYVARKATLGEISFVAVGADSRTSAKVAASAAKHKESAMDEQLREWIVAMGLDPESLTEQQIAKLAEQHKLTIKAAAKTGEQPKAAEFDLRGVTLAYEKHVATVQAKAAEYAGKIESVQLSDIRTKAEAKAVEIKAKALNEEWALPRLEVELIKAASDAHLELVRAERPQGPAIHASSRDIQAPVIEAALSRSAGLRNLDKAYKPEILEAADRSFRNFGLQEMILLAAGMNGYRGRQRIGVDNLREVLGHAFPIRAAGASGVSVSGILSNVANKMLLDGFTTVPQTWRAIAQTRPVNDFKAVTAYRLTASLEYEEVGPTGEIRHGSLGEESYTMAAKTYAKMLALTRQDIINDDLGALNDLRTRLGVGAAIKLSKVFWTLWLASSNGGAFWTAARGNLVTSSALGAAGLATAVAAFRNMTGPDGNLLSLEPALLLVPSALEATAKTLYVSQELRDTTSSTKYPTANIYQNAFRPVVVPELGNSAYTGYSATTWFLLTDPSVLASAIVCFLNGQESPTIESADADFDTLGVQFRGYHDFGVAMTEYRASVKATA